MGGGGFFGSILTTLDSTFGGGLKLFFPTYEKAANIFYLGIIPAIGKRDPSVLFKFTH